MPGQLQTIASGEPPSTEMENLLEFLAQTTGETTALAAPNAGQVMFIGVRESHYPVRYIRHTLMNPEDIEAEIERSIERGWFLGNEEYSPGLMGVALALPMPARPYALPRETFARCTTRPRRSAP